MASEDVTVVRTGPDPDRLRRGTPNPDWRRGRTYLCAYLGVMGPQDGVDLAIRAAAELAGAGRDDIQFVFMGKGDSTDDLVELAEQLGVSDICTFTGRVPDDIVSEVLSTADLGLSPDPLNPLNDVSTMNKTMEYMAFELPVVAFDLKETRVSADVAAVYVEPNDVAAYARAIGDLLADPERRRQMGEQGRRRVVDALAWRHQAPRFVGAYERLSGELGRQATRSRTSHLTTVPARTGRPSALSRVGARRGGRDVRPMTTSPPRRSPT